MSLQVILASAGSGKTQRLAEIACEELTLAFQGKGRGVLAITFTRNAAAELRQRILRQLAARGTESLPLLRQEILGQAPLRTYTIDALIRQLYQMVAPLLGLAVYQRLVVEEEEMLEVRDQLSQALLSQEGNAEFFSVLRAKVLAHAKQITRRVDPLRLIKQELEHQMESSPLQLLIQRHLYAWDAHGEWASVLPLSPQERGLFLWVAQTLEEYRRTHRRLWLQDLSTLVRLVAWHHPWLLAESTAFYHALLVDEAQDTAPLQWDILRPIMEELRNLKEDIPRESRKKEEGEPYGWRGKVVLIGDPKQAIYAWRGASFHPLMEFYEEADEPQTLYENYRSLPTIVSFNNNLYSTCFHRLSADKQDDRRQQAIEALKRLYISASQEPARTDDLSGEATALLVQDDTERAKELQKILADLRDATIPINQTAFLVRSHADAARLIALLPDYPLQLKDITLGSCPSIEITFRYLSGKVGGVEEQYLKQFSAEFRSAWQSQIERLRITSPTSTEPKPLQTQEGGGQLRGWLLWQAFAELYTLWERENRLSSKDVALWKSLLSELYLLLEQHPSYGLSEVLRWWDEKGRRIPFTLAEEPDVYPIYTIHAAKGLAWEAVIIPFAEWSLFSVKWVYPSWRKVSWTSLPPSLQNALTPTLSLFPSPEAIELPLKVSASVKEQALSAIYDEYYVSSVVENFNLHYVATTRARRYLYLLSAKSERTSKSPMYWRDFWSKFSQEKGIADYAR
ncbi:MAG: UvrD-helicase domain-containing protein [Bacteroidia bacterium]|nr:UvrD-helicase domain-containing protein [Bacteroidia bacterium]MDW8235640.1 UvrD-helicase domain-containing protein [Bacteroidia bacterium]